MFKRLLLFGLATGFASASVAQPVPQSTPPSSQPSVPVPHEVLQPKVAIPQTPAGQVLGLWLDAFNSADPVRLQTFFDRHWSPEYLGPDINLRKTTGGLDLLSIRKSEPLRIEFIIKERASPMQGFGVIRIADASTSRIEDRLLGPLPPGAELIGFDIDATVRSHVVDGAISALNDFYVSPETARKIEADLRARLARGEFDKITDGMKFASALNNAMRAISHDKHLDLRFSPVKLSMPPAPPPGAVAPAPVQSPANCGFTPARSLPGNIGLLKFNAFPNPEQCADAASAMMASLGNADAIIVDLRDNGGGWPAMTAYIASYLFDTRTHWNDIWTRKTNATEEFWTRPELPGNHYARQPVFVLTSATTFSGAEELAYSLKALKRAVIVGETTGGGAHPTGGHSVDDRFMIGVPFAKSVNPVTHSDWEGTGVDPDVKVPASTALETATRLAREAIRQGPRN